LARIFWDTNLFIYLLEDNPTFTKAVLDLRGNMLARGDELITSTFTLGEILIKPVEKGDSKLTEEYRGLFSQPEITLCDFDRSAADHYSHIRQDRSIRPADAIQLACAAAVQVHLFITNDERLSRKIVSGIDFITSLGRAPL
jgi:predicted nucleic acid-binding protein